VELDVNDVDNEYILTGYRVNYVGTGQTLKTMFYLHNETFNIWSHFIGMMVFLAIAYEVTRSYPNLKNLAMSGELVEDSWTSSESLNSFLADKLISLNQELDQRATISQHFNSDFYHKIENMSYLSAKNMAESYKRSQYTQNREGDDVSSIMVGIQQLINNFKSFLINAETNAALLKEKVLRLELIKRCLENLIDQHETIKAKFSIWVKNDPMFAIGDIIDYPLVLTYVSRWPLIVHLLSACFCMGCSAIYHLVLIHSEWVSDLFSRLDYGGISVLIAGSCYPPIFYIFSCQPVFQARNWFLALITTSCTGCFFSTMHPRMNKPEYRNVRAIMYVFLGLSAGFPYFYIFYAPASQQLYMNQNYEFFPIALGGAIYILGAVIYALRIPEKWFPKRFDLLG